MKIILTLPHLALEVPLLMKNEKRSGQECRCGEWPLLEAIRVEVQTKNKNQTQLAQCANLGGTAFDNFAEKRGAKGMQQDFGFFDALGYRDITQTTQPLA